VPSEPPTPLAPLPRRRHLRAPSSRSVTAYRRGRALPRLPLAGAALAPLASLFEMCVRVRENSRRVLVPIVLPRSEGPPRLFRLDGAPKAARPVHVSVLGGSAREEGEDVHTQLPVADPLAEAESLTGACSGFLRPVLCQFKLGGRNEPSADQTRPDQTTCRRIPLRRKGPRPGHAPDPDTPETRARPCPGWRACWSVSIVFPAVRGAAARRAVGRAEGWARHRAVDVRPRGAEATMGAWGAGCR